MSGVRCDVRYRRATDVRCDDGCTTTMYDDDDVHVSVSMYDVCMTVDNVGDVQVTTTDDDVR